MATTNTRIAIIPSSQFKWTFQVQYMESLPTRDEAIQYASERGCNLIVEYSRRSGPLFDVLQDPELDCTSEESCEVVEAAPIEAEPERTSWSKSVLGNLFGLAKRASDAVAASKRESSMHTVTGQTVAAE